jgi:hypothetical protein
MQEKNDTIRELYSPSPHIVFLEKSMLDQIVPRKSFA